MKSAPIRTLLCLAALAALPLIPVSAQFDDPMAQKRPPEKEEPNFKVITPKVDKERRSISLSAAFWNQNMTNWVEVAMCGRPSEFLHETIVSITSTRQKMMEACRAAGFRDADYWVSNVADFPRIRGDRALILLEVELDGKKETFPLDELLAYQGWGVSIGPFGWMFKGDPEREPSSTNPATAEADNRPARTQILSDDPQIALQFKGLQHLSRSFMDHPLCYDQWIYPTIRYQRNYAVKPRVLAVPKTTSGGADGKTAEPDDAATSLAKFWVKLYDSNGEIKVTMSVTKVTEEEFITKAAALWHDEKFGAFIKQQVPVARQIDKDKAELEKLIPQFRAMVKKGMPHEDILESETFGKLALLTAQVEKGYAALDAAWGVWAADHPVYETPQGEDHVLDGLKEQTRLWREHLVDWKTRGEHLATAEAARFELRELKAKPEPAKPAITRTTGRELSARSNAILLEIRHVLQYWHYENNRLTPDETRTDWVRNIRSQLELAEAKKEVGTAGVELGGLMQKDGPEADIAKAQDRYKRALTRMAIADLDAKLADVEFEINKRESLEGDPELPLYKQQKTQLKKQIEEIKATTRPK